LDLKCKFGFENLQKLFLLYAHAGGLSMHAQGKEMKITEIFTNGRISVRICMPARANGARPGWKNTRL